MLSKDHFYYQMMKKYIVAFHHIIEDIHIQRIDSNDVVQKDFVVPVTYGTKSKLFSYLQRNENVDRQIKILLPRISYIISAMEFDPTRMRDPSNQCTITSDGTDETFIHSGMPYNFTIDLSIWSVYMDDLLQIIEQIVTFFKPDFILTVKEIEEFNITKNIPVILNGVTFDIENEFDESDRIVKADMNFTLKGFLYPPISEDKLIKIIRLKFGKMDPNKIEETVKLDWDELTDTITTTIHDGDYEG